MRKIAIALLVLSAVVFGAWVATGAHFVTQYQVAKTIEEEDEFGDVVERTEMVDEFQFGLMPDRFVDGALPLGGGFGGLGLGLLIFDLLKRKKDEEAA